MINRKRGSQTPMSLDEIRGYFPRDCDDAEVVISKLSQVIEWERKAESCQVVNVDLDSGTNISAIQFKSQTEMVFHFTEGTSVLVDQTSKTYRIAEHIYEHLSKKLGSVKSFNYSKHNEAVRMILQNFSFSETISPNLSASEINYMFYNCFTKSRSGNDDILYNGLDINSCVGRHEQFCSYVLYTLKNLSRIRDRPGMVIALVAPSDRFRFAIQDRLATVQNKRKHPLKLVLVDTAQTYDKKSTHVYYLLDLFTGAGSIDIGYEYSLSSSSSVNKFLARRLSNVNQYVSRNSSLLFVSHKMFQNVHFQHDTGKYYIRQPDDYSISQTPFVPHKPWVLVCLSDRSSRYLLSFYLSTALSVGTWIERRNTVCNMMIRYNLHRNYDMCNKEMKSRLYRIEEMISLFDHAYPQPGEFAAAMQFPVKLKKVRIAHSNLSTIDMTSLVIGLERMDDGHYYHSNEIAAFFSTKEMLQRAVDLNLIVVDTRKGQQYYSKVKSKYDVENKYFDVPVDDPRYATLLFHDGSIVTGQDHDYKVLRVPFVYKSTAQSLYDTELQYDDSGKEYGIGDYVFSLKSPTVDYTDKEKNPSVYQDIIEEPEEDQFVLSPELQLDVEYYGNITDFLKKMPELHIVQALDPGEYKTRLGIHLWNLVCAVTPGFDNSFVSCVVGQLLQLAPNNLYDLIHDFGALVSFVNQVVGYVRGVKEYS